MQTILLIRHAKAEDRESWSGADINRPLTSAGQMQAKAIAQRWIDSGIASIRSSPALRCVQTISPLSQGCGAAIKIDDALMEGRRILLSSVEDTSRNAICAHGDNIPWLLDELGVKWVQCRKGSIWMIQRDSAGAVMEATYIEPPEA